jgi:hypothetical protein
MAPRPCVARSVDGEDGGTDATLRKAEEVSAFDGADGPDAPSRATGTAEPEPEHPVVATIAAPNASSSVRRITSRGSS